MPMAPKHLLFATFDYFLYFLLHHESGSKTVFLRNVKQVYDQSMECSSMVSIAAFGLGDPGSNLSWFAVSNQTKY